MWESLAAQYGPWGLLGLFVAGLVRALMRGTLIPRRVHLDRVEDLKAALKASEETVAIREQQISILLAGTPNRDAKP